MSLFRRPIFWLAMLVWGIGNALAVASIKAVSELDARTWPQLKLDSEWTGAVSESNQTSFLSIFIGAYVFFVFAGNLWGRVFEYRFGKSLFARVALLGGILSLGSFVLWGVSWRITMWLEDEGYYLAERNTFDQVINFGPFFTWLLGGVTFVIFSILAANKLGKR